MLLFHFHWPRSRGQNNGSGNGTTWSTASENSDPINFYLIFQRFFFCFFTGKRKKSKLKEKKSKLYSQLHINDLHQPNRQRCIRHYLCLPSLWLIIIVYPIFSSSRFSIWINASRNGTEMALKLLREKCGKRGCLKRLDGALAKTKFPDNFFF